MFYMQKPYRCRFDWGRRGTRQAAERGDILVIVDTLSFSTTTVTALHRGGIIYPCSSHEEDPALFLWRAIICNHGPRICQLLLKHCEHG
jgi:2-phosphosulfolactate phosphatase